MKRVCFVIDSLGGGGAENVLVNLVNALDKEKYEITVLTLWSGGNLERKLENHITLKSIDPFHNNLLKRILYFIVRNATPVNLINRFYLNHKYDVYIAYLEGLGTKIVANTQMSANAKKYAWVHIDLVKQNWVLKYFKNIEQQKKAYLQYDRVFAVSKSVKESFRTLFPEVKNIDVQYNLVNDEKVLELASETVELPVKRFPRIVSVGRLNHQKGYDRLLSAHARLLKEGFLHELQILGQGDLKVELEKQTLELGIKETVSFLGFQSNPYKYIKHADAFVCSSRAEGFSTVITEALILGKPIVSTLCAGVDEQLGDSEYGIVTENSEQGIYEGLKKLLSHPDLFALYQAKALDRAKMFNHDRIMKQHEEIIDGGANNES